MSWPEGSSSWQMPSNSEFSPIPPTPGLTENSLSTPINPRPSTWFSITLSKYPNNPPTLLTLLGKDHLNSPLTIPIHHQSVELTLVEKDSFEILTNVRKANITSTSLNPFGIWTRGSTVNKGFGYVKISVDNVRVDEKYYEEEEEGGDDDDDDDDDDDEEEYGPNVSHVTSVTLSFPEFVLNQEQNQTSTSKLKTRTKGKDKGKGKAQTNTSSTKQKQPKKFRQSSSTSTYYPNQQEQEQEEEEDEDPTTTLSNLFSSTSLTNHYNLNPSPLLQHLDYFLSQDKEHKMQIPWFTNIQEDPNGTTIYLSAPESEIIFKGDLQVQCTLIDQTEVWRDGRGLIKFLPMAIFERDSMRVLKFHGISDYCLSY
ncbi:hypothetical protein TREMEDRAFT_59620 [Tremella mesenterica DSM 1558]|uniref:uncharacterized protein n=1 Tax=Tremella mesenterica (strain ATCC 24925 / CBS 8224 / DSM 1558 / NBRC 9311 / NRRL Y-6157 / RJB 2259-6 / UBC 559-6) TaxID=578456 RepID=UPI0003F4A4CF|nr:uncharacterized protein TREMEDRAFT_59620 [Tremella mesenterica DSM 1558]EIW73452.1 hypothetical protein TREMEDRAFT_59620 [Tremella mesenterica DSM 1558]